MSINYKPVTVIIDDFTSRSLTDDHVTLYDAGYLNTVTTYDYYTLDGYTVDDYGDVDWLETTFYGALDYYQNDGSNYLLADTYYNSDVSTGAYGFDAYSYDYLEWVSHNPSSELNVQHGDWVLEAFTNQLDSDVEIILIDFDANDGYMDATQSSLLFSNMDYIIGDWLLKNDTETTNYLPVVVSASFGGTLPSTPESYSIDLLTEAFSVVVQAVPNVTQGGFSWGDIYSDVINVGAYNIDSNGYSLHGNPVDPSVIDILADGYIEHFGWGNGWNFGTSFATPRVAAEITNVWSDLLNSINTQLNTGELTQEELEASGDIDYSDYVISLLDLISTDVYVEMDDGWYSDPVSVLSDDTEPSPQPVQVAQVDFGLSDYHILSAALELPAPDTNSTPTLVSAIADASTNEDSAYSYDTSVNFSDPDNDALTYSATLEDGAALPTWLTIDSETGVLSGTPDNDDTGLISVTVTATDTADASVSDTFYLTVENINDAPTLSGDFTGTVTENSSTNTATGALIGSDVDEYPWIEDTSNWTGETIEFPDEVWTRTRTNTAGDEAVGVMDGDWNNGDGPYTWTETVTLANGEWWRDVTVVDGNGVTTSHYTSSLGDDHSDIETRQPDGTGTESTTGDIFHYGQLYTNVSAIDERDSSGITTSVSGTATSADGEAVTIGMDGVDENGDPYIVLTTQTSYGIDSVFRDDVGLYYIVQNQQGTYGTLALDTEANWIYTLDNSDPDTIALSSGQEAIDSFTINVSDGIDTISQQIDITIISTKANHYVSTSEELQSALAEAQNNGLDDVIHLEKGIYIGNFTYISTEDNDLSILGSYSDNFSIRDLDANTTILDGDRISTTLVLHNGANIFVDGLSIINGHAEYPYQGGGLNIDAIGDITITNNVIADNTASDDAAGLKIERGSSEMYIANNVFDNNIASVDGGAMFVYGGTISNNIIHDNIAGRSGGAIFVFGGESVIFSGNIVYSNESTRGGAIYIRGNSSELTNNTIINNKGGIRYDGGGGIHILPHDSSETIIINNLLYGNTNQQNASGNDIYIVNDEDGNYQTGDITLTNNVFDINNIYIQRSFPIDVSNINNIDPLFIDAANGDYRLSSDSPLIDQGVVTDNVASTDLDGNPRIAGAAVDIGAYEYQTVVVPTTPSSTIITGTTSDDALTVNSDTTSVQAGAGKDTAVFSGNYADYTFSQSDSYVLLLTHNTTEQTVSLFSVEQLQFDDVVIAINNTKVGGEHLVNSTVDGEQTTASLAVLNNGSYVVVWQSSHYHSENKPIENHKIFGQLFSANGEKIGNEFQIYSYKYDYSIETGPSVAPLNDAGFVVTWDSQASNYNEREVFAQLFDSEISPPLVGGAFQVNATTDNTQWHSNLTTLSNGNFVVTWDSYLSTDKAQIFDATGSKVGSELEMTSSSQFNIENGDVVPLKGGGFVVVSELSVNGGVGGVTAQIYSSNGTPIGTELLVETGLTGGANPTASPLKDNSFVVVWDDDYSINASRFDEFGAQVGNKFEVATGSTDWYKYPVITGLTDGGFVVAWSTFPGANNSDYDVFAQIYDKHSLPVGGKFQVNTYSNYSQKTPDIATLNDGGFVITWESVRQDGYGNGIYAQRYDSEGNALGEVTLSEIFPNEVTGTTSDDILNGTTGNDNISPLEGADAVYALAGNDTITLTADSTWTSGYVAKNVGNDSSIGTNQRINLDGMNRFSDMIDGGDDIDTLNLTTGNDAFFIDDVYSDHHESLTLSATSRGIDSTARIVDLETINAGEGNDIVDLTSNDFILSSAVAINGEAGDDTLWGSNGDDTIDGGDGNDTLFGGTGSDTLTGGAGDDTFQFTATAGSDEITDFDLINDLIQLYHRTEDNHLDTDLSLENDMLTWDTGSGDVSVQLTGIVSSDLNDLDGLITFVEIV